MLFLALSNHQSGLSKPPQLLCYAWSMALSTGCKAKGLSKLVSGAGTCYCCSKPSMLKMYVGDTFPIPTILHQLQNAEVNFFNLIFFWLSHFELVYHTARSKIFGAKIQRLRFSGDLKKNHWPVLQD